MIENFKEFTFEAAHQLPPYSGLHGHSFQVQVAFVGAAHPVYGWVTSLTDLDADIEKVRRELHKKYLNEIPGLEVATLANVARWIFTRLEKTIPSIDRIVVSRGAAGRTEGCTYRREPQPVASR